MLVLALGIPFAVLYLAVVVYASHRGVRTAPPEQYRRVAAFALTTGASMAASMAVWSVTVGDEQWRYLVPFAVAVAVAPLAVRRYADDE